MRVILGLCILIAFGNAKASQKIKGNGWGRSQYIAASNAVSDASHKCNGEARLVSAWYFSCPGPYDDPDSCAHIQATGYFECVGN